MAFVLVVAAAGCDILFLLFKQKSNDRSMRQLLQDDITPV
jgi:hypothetical protein